MIDSPKKESAMTIMLRAILLCSLAVCAVFGQGLTGSISGNVSDPSGSAIPGASLTLTNIGTSQTRQGKTDDQGDFVFTQLLPGTFRLVVTGNGFKRYEQTDIVVTSTERVVLGR